MIQWFGSFEGVSIYVWEVKIKFSHKKESMNRFTKMMSRFKQCTTKLERSRRLWRLIRIMVDMNRLKKKNRMEIDTIQADHESIHVKSETIENLNDTTQVKMTRFSGESIHETMNRFRRSQGHVIFRMKRFTQIVTRFRQTQHPVLTTCEGKRATNIWTQETWHTRVL